MATPSSDPSRQHRSSTIEGIEGLRGISVLAVLFYHLNPRLIPGGFVGVDIFFVISGFVVALATSGVSAGNFLALATAFYRRRFVRILPASLIFLVIVQFLAVLFIPTVNRLVDGDRTAAAAAVGASNFVLWWWSADYFSPGPELNPFTHTWSLAVEEQFYLAFPVFVWLIWRAGAGLRRVGLAALGLAIAASIVAAALLTKGLPTFAFYMLPTRFWELGLGVLLFVVIGRGMALADRTLVALQAIGAAFLIAALALTDPMRVPFPDGLLSVIAALALITVSASGPETLVARLLGGTWLRYFGRISYSLYLWHWAVLVLMRWTVGLDGPLYKVLAMGLSWLAADASYRFIESPVRRSAAIARLSNVKVVLAGLFAMALTMGLIVGSVMLRSSITLSVTGNRDDWLPYQQNTAGSCRVEEVSVLLAGGHLSQYSRRGCARPVDTRRLFVVGDSHAMVYQRLFGNLSLRNGVASFVYTESGCAEFPATYNAAREAHCQGFLGGAMADVEKRAAKGDWLFLPGMRVARLCTLDAEICQALPNREYDRAALARERARLKPLLDRGVRVVFEAPKPVFPFLAMRCADWFNRDNPACHAARIRRDLQFQNRAHAMDLISRLHAIDPRIELWDSFPLLCDQPVCQPFRNGRPLFVDTDHVSGYANDLLTPPFEKVLGLGTNRGGEDKFAPAKTQN